MRSLFFFLALLVVVSLIGVGGGIAYGNPLVTLSSVFAVILFMWLGFFVKSRLQKSQENK